MLFLLDTVSKFSKGYSINLNYNPLLSSSYYGNLFSPGDSTPSCPVSAFVSLNGYSTEWVSITSTCLNIMIHGMTTSGLTSEVTFHSSSSFTPFTRNTSISIRAYNAEATPLRLGKLLSLPSYSTTGAYILLNYSTSGEVSGVIRNVRLSLYDIDIETTIIVTPMGLTISSSSGSPYGTYNMNINGHIIPGDTWDRVQVLIGSELTDSSVDTSFFNLLRLGIHHILAETSSYATLRTNTAQVSHDSSSSANLSFTDSVNALQSEYNAASLEYQQSVQTLNNAIDASNQKLIVFDATILLYISQAMINTINVVSGCISDCPGTVCSVPHSLRSCNNDVSFPITGLATRLTLFNQMHRFQAERQVSSCNVRKDCTEGIGVEWTEMDGLFSPLTYDGFQCANVCQSGPSQAITYNDTVSVISRERTEPVISSNFTTSRRYTCPVSTCTVEPLDQLCYALYTECDHSRRLQLINAAANTGTSQANIANLFNLNSEYDALLANVSSARADMNLKKTRMVLLGERLNLTSTALSSAGTVAERGAVPLQTVPSLLEREINIHDWVQSHGSASNVIDISSLNFTTELSSSSSSRVLLHIWYRFPYSQSSSHAISRNIDFNTPTQFNIEYLSNEIISEAVVVSGANLRKKRQQNQLIDTRSKFEDNCNHLKQFMSYMSLLSSSLAEAVRETETAMSTINAVSSGLQERFNDIITNSSSLSTNGQALLRSRETLYLSEGQELLNKLSLTVSNGSIVHWLEPIELYHNSTTSLSGLQCYTLTDCLSALSGYLFSELVRIPSSSASLYSYKPVVNNAIRVISERSVRPVSLADIQRAIQDITNVLTVIDNMNYWCAAEPAVATELSPETPIQTNSSTTLHCRINSTLPVHYQWYKDSVIVSNESTDALTLSDFNDNGLYSCRGVTDIYSVSTLFTYVFSYDPPVLTHVPTRVRTHIYSNEGLRIECQASSRPLPPVWTWEYSNNNVNWEPLVNETSNVLIINNPLMSDSGYYRCTAATEYGSATSAAITAVVLRPSISMVQYNFTIFLRTESSGSGQGNSGSETGLENARSFVEEVLSSLSVTVYGDVMVEEEEDQYYRTSFLISTNNTADIDNIDELVGAYEGELERLTKRKHQIMNYFNALPSSPNDVQVTMNSLTVSQRQYVCPPGSKLESNHIHCGKLNVIVITRIYFIFYSNSPV